MGTHFIVSFNRKASSESEPIVLDTTQKKAQKSTQKILEIIAQNKFVTRAELAPQVGLSESGVKKQLRKLQNEGILKRVGPDKGGYWEIVKS